MKIKVTKEHILNGTVHGTVNVSNCPIALAIVEACPILKDKIKVSLLLGVCLYIKPIKNIPLDSIAYNFISVYDWSSEKEKIAMEPFECDLDIETLVAMVKNKT